MNAAPLHLTHVSWPALWPRQLHPPSPSSRYTRTSSASIHQVRNLSHNAKQLHLFGTVFFSMINRGIRRCMEIFNTDQIPNMKLGLQGYYESQLQSKVDCSLVKWWLYDSYDNSTKQQCYCIFILFYYRRKTYSLT